MNTMLRHLILGQGNKILDNKIKELINAEAVHEEETTQNRDDNNSV